MPVGTTAVSPERNSTSATSTPSRSATIWLNVVAWPWPCGVVPDMTCTVPVGSTLIVMDSQPPAP